MTQNVKKSVKIQGNFQWSGPDLPLSWDISNLCYFFKIFKKKSGLCAILYWQEISKKSTFLHFFHKKHNISREHNKQKRSKRWSHQSNKSLSPNSGIQIEQNLRFPGMISIILIILNWINDCNWIILIILNTPEQCDFGSCHELSWIGLLLSMQFFCKTHFFTVFF